MKLKLTSLILVLSVIAGCTTAKSGAGSHGASAPDPETVMVAYHVKGGSEAEFEKLLAQAWDTYTREKLVNREPHVVVRSEEAGGKPRFIEIFTWVSHKVPDHAPDSVKAIWDKMLALCEKRNGHPALEGGEVNLVAPAK